jgi:hypothetical protein
LLLVVGAHAYGQDCDPQQVDKLLASDGEASDQFGTDVAVSGTRAVIGSPRYDVTGTDEGAAYVFQYDGSGWTEQTILTSSEGIDGDQFGHAVSVSGDVVLVGAYLHDDGIAWDHGSAYVYRYDGANWNEEAILNASDTQAWNLFGYSVGVSGDVAVIGAYGSGGTYAGAAYVFRYNGSAWVEEAKLVSSDIANNDYFGRAVAIDGDTIIVAAYGDDDNGDRSGAAYIFTYDGANWVQQAKLLASDGYAGDRFGWSVSISGDNALVGAYNNIGNGVLSGAAYVFTRNGSNWTESARLTPSDGELGDQFGWAVAIRDDVLVVGANYVDDVDPDSRSCNSGAAYLFAYDGTDWIEQPKIRADDAVCHDEYASEVAVDAETAIIGCYKRDDLGTWSGAAYVEDLGCGDCPPDFNGDTVVNSQDFIAFLNAFVAGDPTADFNGDGEVNSQDFIAFLNAFVTGC